MKEVLLMKKEIQSACYYAAALWHRLHIFFYQRLGDARVAAGMPQPQSPEAASLLALCRKTNRRLCKAMELDRRRAQLTNTD
mgnify:FL=1|jgi:hypothetical protein